VALAPEGPGRPSQSVGGSPLFPCEERSQMAIAATAFTGGLERTAMGQTEMGAKRLPSANC
jgi:hypothetical protein